MIYAVFFAERADGTVVGHCDSLPAWPGVAANTIAEGMRAARASIPAFINEHLVIVGYKLPTGQADTGAPIA